MSSVYFPRAFPRLRFFNHWRRGSAAKVYSSVRSFTLFSVWWDGTFGGVTICNVGVEFFREGWH